MATTKKDKNAKCEQTLLPPTVKDSTKRKELEDLGRFLEVLLDMVNEDDTMKEVIALFRDKVAMCVCNPSDYRPRSISGDQRRQEYILHEKIPNLLKEHSNNIIIDKISDGFDLKGVRIQNPFSAKSFSHLEDYPFSQLDKEYIRCKLIRDNGNSEQEDVYVTFNKGTIVILNRNNRGSIETSEISLPTIKEFTAMTKVEYNNVAERKGIYNYYRNYIDKQSFNGNLIVQSLRSLFFKFKAHCISNRGKDMFKFINGEWERILNGYNLEVKENFMDLDTRTKDTLSSVRILNPIANTINIKTSDLKNFTLLFRSRTNPILTYIWEHVSRQGVTLHPELNNKLGFEYGLTPTELFNDSIVLLEDTEEVIKRLSTQLADATIIVFKGLLTKASREAKVEIEKEK